MIIEIREYNGYLLIKVNKIKTPKLNYIGTGTLFTGFNKEDLGISKEALHLLKTKNDIKSNEEPVLEMIGENKLYFASNKSIIIPPNEIFKNYNIPKHTVIDNNIDDVLKEQLNKKNV